MAGEVPLGGLRREGGGLLKPAVEVKDGHQRHVGAAAQGDTIRRDVGGRPQHLFGDSVLLPGQVSVQDMVEIEITLKAYIHEAIEVEKAGLEVAFEKSAELVLPEELRTRLAENHALRIAFETLTPGRQRGYALYFSEPKQAKTRESRIDKCLQQILNGKGLNDRPS